MLEKFINDKYSYPLTFLISLNNKKMSCGVREFTSEENAVEIPKYACLSLYLDC